MTNAEIARAFEELGTLYELDGAVKYRVLAYTRAAKAIRDSPVSVAQLVRAGRATELEGVGKTIEEKLIALLEEGEIPAARKLLDKYPESLLEVTRVPGLGAKTVRKLYEELGIASLEDLRDAAENERIRTVSGLGPKTESRILIELERMEARADEPERRLLSEMLPVAETLVGLLREHPAADRVEIAGSVRRMTETCKDIDLVASSGDGLALATYLTELDPIARAGNPGVNGVRAETHGGIPVDLRIVEPPAFGNLWQHFTGSKAHNVRLRETAVAEGYSVSEHGIKDIDTGEVTLHTTEVAVYEHLGYRYIDPQLRENRGELEAARESGLPDLVTVADIRGELHCHTTLSDGRNTLAEMAAAARERGLVYMAITDHSASHGFGNAVDDDALRARIEEIAVYNEQLAADGISDFRVLAGSEVNIGLDGGLDYPDELLAELDWVIASVHSSFSPDSEVMTARIKAAIENPRVDCIGHLTGRLIGRRDPYPVDIEALLEAAVEHQTFFEINGNPNRRDLSEVHARLAGEAGVPIILTTDAHGVETLDNLRYAVATARRAWLTPADIANTRDWPELLTLRGR